MQEKLNRCHSQQQIQRARISLLYPTSSQAARRTGTPLQESGQRQASSHAAAVESGEYFQIAQKYSNVDKKNLSTLLLSKTK